MSSKPLLDHHLHSLEVPLKLTTNTVPDAVRNTLCIIIPAYNEEDAIAAVLEELDAVLITLNLTCSILIVDDGSEDSTADKVLNTQLHTPLKLVRFSRNFGKEIAMSAGLKEAQHSDAVVIMDADGQHPPTSIPEFIKYWEQGYEDIYAIRKARDTDSWIRRKLSLLFYKLLPKESHFIRGNVGDFRLLSAQVVAALNKLPEKNRFMKGLYSWVGFKKYAISYDHRQRHSGETKFTMRSLLAFAVTGITSFSNMPLRVISRLGFLISGFSILYGVFIILKTLIFGSDLAGWATLTVGITLLSGIQLISIGVLGEYIGQVFIEAKNRPLYLIEEILYKVKDEVTSVEEVGAAGESQQ